MNKINLSDGWHPIPNFQYKTEEAKQYKWFVYIKDGYITNCNGWQHNSHMLDSGLPDMQAIGNKESMENSYSKIPLEDYFIPVVVKEVVPPKSRWRIYD